MSTPLRSGRSAPAGGALLAQGLDESHRGRFHALHTLAAAQDVFVLEGNEPGAALCAAALLVTGQGMMSFRGFREHIDALAGLRDGALRYADRAEDLLAHAGLLAGLLMFAPSDPFGEHCVERIFRLLELDVNLRFAAARLVLFYTEPREQRERGDRVNALVEPLMGRPELTPHRLGRWLTFRIRVAAAAKDRLQLDRVKAQARELVRRHAEPDVTIWLAIADFDAALPRRDFDGAQRALAVIEGVLDPANLSDLRRIEWLKARLALARGEGDAALFHAIRATKYAQDLEVPPPMMGVMTATEGQARLATGDLAGARACFETTAQMVAVLHAEEMRDMIRMVDAYEAVTTWRDDSHAMLATAFGSLRARQFYDGFDTNPRFGATMCALALEHDVEPEFVGRVIALQGFAPPPQAGAAWPWQVRIATFGRFEVAAGGQPVAAVRKSARKPLELLKALIAAGGRSVDKDRLADWLWPDASAEAASAALGMAVMRLRKLLSTPQAVVLKDGKIGLDPQYVWLDLWAFDREVDALQPLLRAHAAENVVAAIGERLLAFYRGPFLDHENPQRWLLATRERARARFLRTLTDAGRYWEQRGRWPVAAALYERGLEVDALAEDFYRNLMRCHLAQGRTADAARTLQRCRDVLQAELGVPPSAETEALFRSALRR